MADAKSGFISSCRNISTLAAAAALFLPLAAAAAPDTAAEPLETIIVTGSYLGRTDTETPSPVTVIDSEEIARSGLTSIADVIRSVSGDNSGTLTQAFSGALAGGASGVSLRAMSVDATLVLVDGHRMAAYPLGDDGQRPFVDISSLPLGLVERVEVLKDGASAIYGSDAIAGVVNIILRKQFVGTEVSGSVGTTSENDGNTQHVSALYGFGDLHSDGHNVYFNIEYRHQQEILQEHRGSYLNQLDLTRYGGPDLRGGIPGSLPYDGSAYAIPGQVAPLGNGQQLDNFYLLPGCAPQNLVDTTGCAWDTNTYKRIQPRTEGFNLTGHYAQALAGSWMNSLTASFFQSDSEQYRQSNLYNAPVTLVPFAWGGARGGNINQFDPTTTQIVLPANHPDNPFNPASPYAAAAAAYYGSAYAGYIGLPALFYGALTDFPAQHALYDTDVVRVADDLSGTAGSWNLSASAGYVRVATKVTYQSFVRASALYAALADGSYRVGQNAGLNSPALHAALAPTTHDTAVSELTYLALTGSRPLMPLPGGDLAVATGIEARWERIDNPGEPYAIDGDIIMDGSFYAHGSQNIYAAFAELSAPLSRAVELDAAARYDHYNQSGSSFTPKAGIKWKLAPQIALRGTYARGFRAPGIAESGDAGVGTSVAPAPSDPLRCPTTGSTADCGGPGSSVAILERGNANLQPEKSRSYTLGVIVEPFHNANLTLDYFNIRRDNEIATEPYDPLTNALRSSPTPGSSLPGPIVAYVTPFVNASYSLTAGFDAELKMQFGLGAFGKLEAGIEATHLTESKQVFGDTTYDYLGTVGPTGLGGSVGTPSTRGALNIDWTRGPLMLGATYTYHSATRGVDESVGPECIQLSADNPHCYVAGFGYADVHGQYTWSDHFDINASIRNVTNRLPPLNNVTYGGQNYNPSLDQAGAVGRFMALGFRYHL